MDFDPYGDLERAKISPLDAKRKKEREEQARQAENSEEGTQTTEDIKTITEQEPMTNEQEKVEQTRPRKKQKEPGEEPPKEEEKQSGVSAYWDGMVEHFVDLRKQIIKSLVVFIIFFIAVFSTINIWFPYVTRGYKLIVLSPIEVISFYTMIAASLALGLSIPFICYFIWQFVKPGLKEEEWGFISFYAPVIFLLFIVGLLFGYFIVNPLSYNFLMKLGQINFDMMISAKEYARFLLLTTMPIGLMFQLPIVTLFLSSIGVLTSKTMKKVRKWSYIILAIVSALITPPDFISQLIILIPMIALYEISLFIVVRKEKKKEVLKSAVI